MIFLKNNQNNTSAKWKITLLQNECHSPRPHSPWIFKTWERRCSFLRPKEDVLEVFLWPPPSFWQSITMLFQKFQILQKSAKNFLDWNPSPPFCNLFQKGMVKTPTICYLIFFGLDKRSPMLKKSFIWYAMFVHWFEYRLDHNS